MESSESSAEMYSSTKASQNGPLDPLRKISHKTSWLALAAASGACAAINGLFAKLTTTELTSAWSSAISGALGLVTPNKSIEFLIRAIFFLLNLTFNALMWALFTAALTRATSTTRVSIINTSSNFMVTALLGLAIFQENLPPLWWVGAGGLVVGTVTIGRREEEGAKERKVGPVAEEYQDRIGEGEDEISDGIEMGGNELKDRQKEADTGKG